MLVSPLVPNKVAAAISVVVTVLGGIITSAFSSILFNFFYRNRGSNYITEPYREYYGGFY